MQVSFLCPSFAVPVIPCHHKKGDKGTAVSEHSHMWVKYKNCCRLRRLLHRNPPTCHSGSITWGTFTLRLCIQAAVKHQVWCLHKNYVLLSQWLQFSAVHDCIIYRPHLFSTFSVLSNILPVQIRWRPKVSSSPVSYLANFCRKGRCGATQTVTFLLLFKKTKVFFILTMKSSASYQ